MATLTINRQTEMVSVSEATRHLAGLLTKLQDRMASKFLLTKNNTIEEYEKLLDLEAELDHLKLHNEITLREKSDADKRITLAELDKVSRMVAGRVE